VLASQALGYPQGMSTASGGWWATRKADEQRTSPWQGAYHRGRALLYSAKLLEELAGKR
jgi:hypothetical protein